MSFPWQDWQFWAVTLAACVGVWTLVRQLVPSRGQGETPCGHCAAGSAACAAKAARERLAGGGSSRGGGGGDGAPRLRVLPTHSHPSG